MLTSEQTDWLGTVRAAVRRAEEEPEWFVRHVLRQPNPLRWQLDLYEAAMDVRLALRRQPTKRNHQALGRLSYVSGHGTGKTFALATLAHLWQFTTYGKIAVTGPKLENLKTRFMARFREIHRAAESWYSKCVFVGQVHSSFLNDTDWGVQLETASDPDNLAGYHAASQLFLIDEASAERIDRIYEVVEGALTTPGSLLVEIGNPTRSRGSFWAHHNKPSESSLYFRRALRPHDAEGLVSEEWIENMRSKYGADSPVFKVRCLGEFVTHEEGQLIPYAWIAEAKERAHDSMGALGRLVVSVDVGDGADPSVITAARLYDSGMDIMLRQEQFSFETAKSPLMAADRGIDMFKRFGGSPKNGDVLVIDGLGVGAGSAGHAMNLGYPVVIYKGGAGSDNPDEFRNRRVQSYISLRNAHRDGLICYAEGFLDNEEEWDEYAAELTSIKTRPGAERVEDLETKDAHIARTGSSPNRADSVAMIYATQVPIMAPGFSSSMPFSAATCSGIAEASDW